MLVSHLSRAALVGILTGGLAMAGHAQKQLAGDWTGTLNVQGTTVHLVWHVTSTPDGAVTSTFDNVDEGVTGIKVKSMELQGPDLTATVDDSIEAGGENVHVAGVLKGKLNADGTEVTGTWEQSSPQEQTGEIDLKRTAQESAGGAAQASGGSQAAKIAGDWQGTLKAGGAELRLVLHIQSADGKLSATLDSVDQGAMGIPVSEVKLEGSKLNLTVDAVQGTYEGTVNADATGIDGTWSQSMAFPLSFTRAAAQVVAKAQPKPAAPTDVDGTWMGTLDLGATKLRAVFKITNTSEGLTGQMQSPDQSPNWLPVTSVTHEGDSITIEMKQVGASFTGKVSSDKLTIDGTFTQMGNTTPLTLKRVADAA